MRRLLGRRDPQAAPEPRIAIFASGERVDPFFSIFPLAAAALKDRPCPALVSHDGLIYEIDQVVSVGWKSKAELATIAAQLPIAHG
jgi:hypothetical protein